MKITKLIIEFDRENSRDHDVDTNQVTLQNNSISNEQSVNYEEVQILARFLQILKEVNK